MNHPDDFPELKERALIRYAKGWKEDFPEIQRIKLHPGRGDSEEKYVIVLELPEDMNGGRYEELMIRISETFSSTRNMREIYNLMYEGRESDWRCWPMFGKESLDPDIQFDPSWLLISSEENPPQEIPTEEPVNEAAGQEQPDTQFSEDNKSHYKAHGEQFALIQTGPTWKIIFAGKEIAGLRGKGFRIIHYLVSNPQKFFQAKDLSALINPPINSYTKIIEDSGYAEDDEKERGDSLSSDPTANGKTWEVMITRMIELKEELSDAERDNDLGRKERIQEELEQIQSYLTRSTGDARFFMDENIRVKNTIIKSISRALDKIYQFDPTIGRHFRNALKPISRFSYHPDQPIKWILKV